MTRAVEPVLSARKLRLAYGTRTALAASDLELPPRTITALIGPNGSGKSSLLSAAAGLLRPADGSLRVLGEAPVAVQRRVAYVLQSTVTTELLPVTVREAVTMGRFANCGMLGRLRRGDRQAVQSCMERLEVADLGDRHLRELSAGQRQRVLVAQGLAQEAELLLLDEPVTGLDLVSRQRIFDAVRSERAAGRAVIFATHDLDDARIADHVVLLAGRVVAAGRPDAVLTADHLMGAYGGRLLQLDGGSVLDDHHTHGHGSTVGSHSG